ncbi:hypothetical protein ATI02_1900 [Pseudomonas baetica]|uniref:Uncharacterized protein n=2 Tax=Pseudomonas baetica TaxID=674054 RepID=A0ABX4PVK9_9PSED|nr:hypothetical protein ATI02_1900 [Pseudomonas baetica]
MVEQAKILAAGIWILLILAFIAPALIVLYGMLAYPQNFPTPIKDLSMFVQAFSGYALYGILPLSAYCSGQLIPDTTLSFSSARAGANPPLN